MSGFLRARLVAGGAMALGAAVWIARGLHAWANPPDLYADWR